MPAGARRGSEATAQRCEGESRASRPASQRPQSWKGRGHGGTKGSDTPEPGVPPRPGRRRKAPRRHGPRRAAPPLSADPASRAAHVRTDAPSGPRGAPPLGETAAAPYVTRPPRARSPEPAPPLPGRERGRRPGREGNRALRNGARRPAALTASESSNPCRYKLSYMELRGRRAPLGVRNRRCEGAAGAESGRRPVRRGPEPALSALRTPQPRGAASRAHRRHRRRCPRRRRAAPQPPARLPPRPAPRAAAPPLAERHGRRAAIGRARPPPRRHWLRRSAVRGAPEHRRPSAPRQPGSGAGKRAASGRLVYGESCGERGAPRFPPPLPPQPLCAEEKRSPGGDPGRPHCYAPSVRSAGTALRTAPGSARARAEPPGPRIASAAARGPEPDLRLPSLQPHTTSAPPAAFRCELSPVRHAARSVGLHGAKERCCYCGTQITA